MKFTLSKNQKLKSRKAIAQLFTEGQVLKSYPVKLVFLPNNEGVSKVAFSVPKRNFKLAVHRNRIKRILRESYRLNQHNFFEEQEFNYNLMFIFMGNKIPTFFELDKKIRKMSLNFKNRIES